MPKDRISNANTRAVRIIVFSATLLGLGGCMSSPEQQFSRIETTAAVRRDTVVQANPQQQQPQDEIDAAVQADANDRSLDNFGVEPQPSVAQPQGFGIRPKNIAATQNSIYSTTQSDFTQQGVTQKGNRVRPLVAGDQVAAVKSSIYANTSVEAVIAADNTGAQADDVSTMPSYESLAERMAVPLPDADDVKRAQDVAMVGTEVPVLDPNATLAANAAQQVPETEVAAADPAMAQPDLVSALQPRAEIVEEEKPLTLAALFRKSDPHGFNRDAFGKKKLVTRSIPNMQMAAIRPDSLPGVTTNAMFPTTMNALPDDEHADEEDDGPTGLMKLASLPSMTRIAPNGLYLQTDKVEVSCLRPELVSLIHTVENHYKRPAIVTSGFRDPGRNRRSGGARHSLHTMCAAADIQVQGVSKWQLADFVRSLPGRGGVGTYCHTESVHIDIGGERDWNWRCRRKSRLRG